MHGTDVAASGSRRRRSQQCCQLCRPACNAGGSCCSLILPQATPVKAGRPSGIVVTVPYLRIRAAQREAYKQGQVQPSWGSWLDVYLTVLAPLPPPVGGILGELPCPPAPCMHSRCCLNTSVVLLWQRACTQPDMPAPHHEALPPHPRPAGRTYTPAQAAVAAGGVSSQAGGAMPMASFEFQVQP